jgi:MFS family permease
MDPGFGLGPVFWAPLSEIYGRNFAFMASYPVFVIFNVVGAVAPNIETILISRFIAGTFGSSPITNAGGQVSDMWAA